VNEKEKTKRKTCLQKTFGGGQRIDLENGDSSLTIDNRAFFSGGV